MKIIDLETWDRKEHYQFFRRAAYAHYHIGADLDITRFKSKIKAQGLPFSFAMTYGRDGGHEQRGGFSLPHPCR